MRIFRAEMGVGNRWGMVSLGRRFDAVDAGLLDIYWIFTGYLLDIYLVMGRLGVIAVWCT